MQLNSIEGSVISIKGNIKTISDYQEFKSQIQKLVDGGHQEITIRILDSYTVTSAVIGYLFKIININKVKVNFHVRDERLHKILEDLKLTEVLNVQKING